MTDASGLHKDTDQPTIDEDGPLGGFLCFSIYSTGLAFNRIYKPLLDKLGLTYVQYLVVIALADHENQSVSELGDQLFLESNTLTPLIKRLESAGLVTRKRDSKDERVVRVSLTQEGRSIALKAACVPDEIMTLTGLSQKELGDMQKSLLALRRTLRAHI